MCLNLLDALFEQLDVFYFCSGPQPFLTILHHTFWWPQRHFLISSLLYCYKYRVASVFNLITCSVRWAGFYKAENCYWIRKRSNSNTLNWPQWRFESWKVIQSFNNNNNNNCQHFFLSFTRHNNATSATTYPCQLSLEQLSFGFAPLASRPGLCVTLGASTSEAFTAPVTLMKEKIWKEKYCN